MPWSSDQFLLTTFRVLQRLGRVYTSWIKTSGNAFRCEFQRWRIQYQPWLSTTFDPHAFSYKYVAPIMISMVWEAKNLLLVYIRVRSRYSRFPDPFIPFGSSLRFGPKRHSGLKKNCRSIDNKCEECNNSLSKTLMKPWISTQPQPPSTYTNL